MKLINLSLIMFLVFSLNAQVNVKGAETTKTISNQREVVFERKEIDVTKYVEESPSQKVIIVNDIKGAELVESSDDAVRIKISPRGAEAGIDKDGGTTTAASSSEKKRIVIDLEPNTPKGALVDVSGRQIKGGAGDAGAINNWAIFFDTDGFRIKNEYNAVINNVATYLALNPNVKVKLVGYTDTRYTAKYNLQLSNRRVNEVANRFKALGIDEGRIQTEAKGDSKVVVDVDSKASLKHQLNRRVTITFLD